MRIPTRDEIARVLDPSAFQAEAIGHPMWIGRRDWAGWQADSVLLLLKADTSIPLAESEQRGELCAYVYSAQGHWNDGQRCNVPRKDHIKFQHAFMTSPSMTYLLAKLREARAVYAACPWGSSVSRLAEAVDAVLDAVPLTAPDANPQPSSESEQRGDRCARYKNCVLLGPHSHDHETSNVVPPVSPMPPLPACSHGVPLDMPCLDCMNAPAGDAAGSEDADLKALIARLRNSWDAGVTRENCQSELARLCFDAADALEARESPLPSQHDDCPKCGGLLCECVLPLKAGPAPSVERKRHEPCPGCGNRAILAQGLCWWCREERRIYAKPSPATVAPSAPEIRDGNRDAMVAARDGLAEYSYDTTFHILAFMDAAAARLDALEERQRP